MTSAELIAKIKAEIERNRQAIRVLNEHTAPEQMSKTCAIFQYSDTILSALLSFLSSLESEKPVPNDLEEAANRFAVFYDQGTCDGIAQDCFIAGAKWQADHTPLPEDTVLFNKGVEEGKRLMMEEAVEGEVHHYATVHYVTTNESQLSARLKQFQDGDKVRIIIVKEGKK